MDWAPGSIIRWLFDSEYGLRDRLIPRWIFLRALGLIYFSAFYSLVFQIRGLIGAEGILPSNEFLAAVAHQFGAGRFWFAPTLLWISTGPHMLTAICWVGMIASLLLAINFWPRGMLLICFVCFLSFVSAAQDFSGYQSDGMLLEAGFISLFFAPPGFWPGLGRAHPPSRASLFLLQWEWFRIYFESGMVKLASGDPAVAQLHRHGRVLPERPSAHLDRLVRAAPAALGFTPSLPAPRWCLSSDWCSCCFCHGAGASSAFSL